MERRHRGLVTPFLCEAGRGRRRGGEAGGEEGIVTFEGGEGVDHFLFWGFAVCVCVCRTVGSKLGDVLSNVMMVEHVEGVDREHIYPGLGGDAQKQGRGPMG